MVKSNDDKIYFCTTVIIMLIMTLYFTVNRASDKIEQLQHEIDSNAVIIDSLKHEIDTLNWEQKIFYQNTNNEIISAIMFVESSYNNFAYNPNEDAVGCLQIRRCMVDDINRILERKNSLLRFNYNDRWSRKKSIQMFEIYRKYYNLNTYEKIARCWNGGPNGIHKPTTADYWDRVKTKING